MLLAHSFSLFIFLSFGSLSRPWNMLGALNICVRHYSLTEIDLSIRLFREFVLHSISNVNINQSLCYDVGFIGFKPLGFLLVTFAHLKIKGN